MRFVSACINRLCNTYMRYIRTRLVETKPIFDVSNFVKLSPTNIVRELRFRSKKVICIKL